MSSEDNDFLTEDPEVPGQKFCLLSFLSPENVLKEKKNYFFNQFLSTFEVTLKSELLEKFLASTVVTVNDALEAKALESEKADLSGVADVCRRSKVQIDSVLTGLQAFVKKNVAELSEDKIKESYDSYMYTHGQKLEDEFYKKNGFHTTVRGMKVRGVYNSHEEAVARSKKLQRMDTLHNIFVGEIGKWLPWDPEPSRVANNEYADDQLNTLMKKYKENEEAREEFYRDKKEQSVKRNVEAQHGVTDSSAMFNTVGALARERKMEAK